MSEKLIHIAILLAAPPLLLGVINKVKAWVGGRVGPPLLQAYYDLIKLMQKGIVLSTTTTWIFRFAPAVTVASVVLAGLMLPLARLDAPISFSGDLIFFAYLLGLARFFTTAAALDTGSAFEGMGAAREVTFGCLSEPAFFFALLVLVQVSGSVTLTGMLRGATLSSSTAASASLILVAIGLFVVMLAETCRIPVDDPNTHLELTMIHEVMVLDNSGPLLGLVLYAGAVKLFLFGAVLVQIVAPIQTGRPWLDDAFFALGMLGIAVAVGIVESVMARLQMRHVPYLLVGAMLVCGFAFLLLIR